MGDASTEFDAAKAVFEQLQPLDKEQQARVMRWVAESLDIKLHVKAVAHEPHTAAPVTEAPSKGPEVPSKISTDIKTFVESKSPKSEMQLATVVAYYYKFEAPAADRKETIDSSVLQEATRLCGRARLSNPRVTLHNAKGQGYLDSPSRGQFRINTVGENLVAMALSNGGTAPVPAAPRKKRARKKSK